MQVNFTHSAFTFFLAISTLHAQTAKDVTVPITANVSTNPAAITLTWPNPAASGLFIQRRTKGQSGLLWTQLLSVANSTQTTLTDTNVVAGQTYEYYIRRSTSINAHGYVQVAVEAPATHSRGKLLLFVDADIVALLAPEIERLRYDLVGDGWQIVEHITDNTATVQSVKNQIVADYNADPANVKSVFLLGKIPIPYSGNYAWDGHHPEHSGAWPSDVYYADINSSYWTDVSVNNTIPDRMANDNVPGDGKFDQSTLPSPVELQVGRVDFRRLSEGTFGATTVELLRRYLDKNHNWRTGAYTVENKALVDDNFYYFNGEAFASDGYRNAYPLVGEANIVEADFFDNTNPQSFLMGYGCGGGGYSSASGVGNSANFATDTVNIVFSNLFGSLHGDWDYETNPFMPSALASRGGILTCSWAGRPHHFYQALASGETMGYCMKETLNAPYNNAYFPSITGEGGIQTALLGDPTLRAHIVESPQQGSIDYLCAPAKLQWKAVSDTNILGYHVYTANRLNGPWSRLTDLPIVDTVFQYYSSADTQFFMIKTVKWQHSPGGGIYQNTSTGFIMSFVAPGGPVAVVAEATGGTLTCGNAGAALHASSNFPNSNFYWSGPGNFVYEGPDPTVFLPGEYTVLVYNSNGCTATATASVAEADSLTVAIQSDLNCNPVAEIGAVVNGGIPPYQYLWSTGDTTSSILLDVSSTVSLTVTDAGGCSSEVGGITILVTPPVTLLADIKDETAPGANDGSIDLTIAGGTPPFIYTWSNGAAAQDLTDIPGGIYSVTITAANGCTDIAVFVVNTIVGTHEAAVFQQLLLAPNPTEGTSLLSIQLYKTALVRVAIRDEMGRLVWEKPEINLHEIQIPLDLEESPPGGYTVFVFVGNEVFARKLAVVR